MFERSSIIDITERKAPTDESIRLYDEIKERAFKSIVKTVSSTEPMNILKYKAIASSRSFNSFDTLVYYNFILNGVVFEGKCSIEPLRNDDVIQKLFKIISEEITQQLFQEAYNKGELQMVIKDIR